MMTLPAELRYDLFLSYAHKDNQGNDTGRVTLLKEWIEIEYERVTSRKLRVFFDVEDIRSMDDWSLRILTGLRQSRVMVAVLSPNYFASNYCRKEWEEYLDQELSHALPGQGIAPIYVIRHPSFDAYDPVKSQLDMWLQNLKRRQFVNCLDWWPEGQRALEREGVRKQLTEVNDQIVTRLAHAAKRDASPTNLPRYNKRFVGRTDELHQLREALIRGKFGAVTAVNGIGGIGKSALALVYGYAYGHEYPGGRFWINCAGMIDLRGSLISLAPYKGVPLSSYDLQQRDVAFVKVRAAFEKGPQALLILDNIDDAELLNPAVRDATLPTGDHIHVLVTTRIAPQELHEIECVPLDALPTETALNLLSRYRPISDAPQDDEWKAALEIVHRLGGHALAVEVVAVYLSRHPEISLRQYSNVLQSEGITLLEETGADKRVQLSRHPERSIRRLLTPTLASLSAAESKAIAFAALLPPDQVVMPWLKDLLQEDFPELDFEEVFAHLEGLRLITPGDDPRIRRIHRIVQAVVKSHISAKTMPRLESRLVRCAHVRAKTFERHWGPRCSWEVLPLTAFVEPRLSKRNRVVGMAATLIAGGLEKIGRTTAARRLCSYGLTTSLVLVTQAKQDANPSLLHTVYLASQYSGDFAATDGELELARLHYDVSLKFAEIWSDLQPKDLPALHDLWDALMRIGELCLKTELAHQARTYFERAREIAEYSTGDRAAFAAETSASHSALGEACLQLDDQKKAQKHFRIAMEINARSVPFTHDAKLIAKWLASVKRYFDLGSIRAVNLVGYCITNATEAIDRVEQAMSSDLDQWDHFSSVLIQLGDLCSQRGDSERAEVFVTRAVHFLESTINVMPDDVVLQRRLTEAYLTLTDLKLIAGKTEDAAVMVCRGRELAERSASELPEDAVVEFLLSASYEKTADVALQQTNAEQAHSWYERAREMREHAFLNQPNDAKTQGDLAAIYDKLADWNAGQGNFPEALSLYEQSLESRARLGRSAPDNAAAQFHWAIACNKLAGFNRAQEKLDAAHRLEHQTLEILEQTAHRLPNDLVAQRNWMAWCDYLSARARAGGSISEAEQIDRRNLDTREQLAREFPDAFEPQHSLATAYSKLGFLRESEGKWDESRSWFMRSLQIDLRLIEDNCFTTEVRRKAAATRFMLLQLAIKADDDSAFSIHAQALYEQLDDMVRLNMPLDPPGISVLQDIYDKMRRPDTSSSGEC